MALHVHEWGPPGAPSLVCLHGVTAHGARFRKLAEERLRGFRVVAPDLRGHGRSEWEPPWRLERHVDDLLETVSRRGIDRATWLGHSFGARLALELAVRRPELVAALVLLDPVVWVPPPIALERSEEAGGEQSFASTEEAVEWRLHSGTVAHAPRELLEEEAETHLVRGDDGRLRFRYSRAAVAATIGELALPPPPLGDVRARTLVVRGASSEVCPEVVVDALRHGLGDLLTAVEVQGGHTVLWDGFAETAGAIASFLDAR